VSDWKNSFLEFVGILLLGLILFGGVFTVWCYAQGTIDLVDSVQNARLSVVESQILELARRVTCIEDRLFMIFSGVVLCLLGTITNSLFTIRVHRNLRENGKGG
jgi:hypothetical protein